MVSPVSVKKKIESSTFLTILTCYSLVSPDLCNFQGYCATDMNGHKGTRPAVEGAISCISPIEENILITGKESKCNYQSGGFYMDSAPKSYCEPAPAQFQ